MARAATRENGKARSPAAYSLDKFAPPDVRFSINGREYRISGDPDVEVVVQMLRLERQIKGLEESERGAAELIVEARDLIKDLVLERDPKFDGTIRIGVGQILTLFALITGGESVADAAAEAITAGMSLARDLTPEELEERLEEMRGGGDSDAPFESTKRSSRRSSN